MRAPAFWQYDGLLAWLLSPLAAIYRAETARRVARPGWRAPVPVICCGNASAGGSGKTTVTLDLGARLMADGRRVGFITRGYGGQVRGAVRVDGQDAAEVGDEALLLAALGPTYAGADRAAAARLAVADGAQILVMDDGLQNPSLAKNFSLLVIDGASGFGNSRVIPSGPLREPVAAAAARCQAAVLIGEDVHGALGMLPPGLSVLRAGLEAGPEAAALRGQPVFAFAGIGRPAKFRETLQAAGVKLVGSKDFPDHHRYGDADIAAVLAEASRCGGTAVTTPKDAVRLPAATRAKIGVIGVRLAWQDTAALEAILRAV
jgi:tetraacyldisaccharide 4'-kinase